MDDECDKFTIDFFTNPKIQISRLWTLSEMSEDDFTFTISELLSSAKRLKIDERLIPLFNARYNKFIEEKTRIIEYNDRLAGLHKIYTLWGVYLIANELFTNEAKQKWFIKTASIITDDKDINEFEYIFMEMVNEENISHIDLLKLSNRYNKYISNGCKFDDEV